jgi:hypothetical protein
MIDLSTNYLGLQLRTPLVASASPLSRELDGIRRLEDAGASALRYRVVFVVRGAVAAGKCRTGPSSVRRDGQFRGSIFVLPAAVRVPPGTRRISGSHPGIGHIG